MAYQPQRPIRPVPFDGTATSVPVHPLDRGLVAHSAWHAPARYERGEMADARTLPRSLSADEVAALGKDGA